MIQQANELYEQLVEKLREAELSPLTSPIQNQKASLKHIQQAIAQLKELVLGHTFAGEQEEIFFFKHLKPKFTSLLIYHSRLALITLNKPLGSVKDLRRHYENELLLIRIFHDHHVQLYQYLLSEATFLDARLFLRGNSDLPWHYSTSSVDSDTRFTTHYDYVVARIQANERLRHYLLQALKALDSGQLPQEKQAPGNDLAWTGSKVHLIELAYALCESGQINSGTSSVNEIAGLLEEIFHVKFAGVYRTFQEMRQRKRDSRTKFLDLMKERLLHRMDELDAG